MQIHNKRREKMDQAAAGIRISLEFIRILSILVN
jgi:hypothetical protein